MVGVFAPTSVIVRFVVASVRRCMQQWRLAWRYLRGAMP
jgi:hypothetical protein